METLAKQSPCKVNLLLNTLGKRADGFHALETVLHPLAVFDELRFERTNSGLQLTCTDPALPTDSRNLVLRAADTFFQAAKIGAGLRVHLQKRIPLGAGLGGGSANAALTLLALNELFGQPIPAAQLPAMAASLGSDVPFFLQRGPALATGRGEQIHPLPPFPALRGKFLLLLYPGFGIPTAWAYEHLAPFPEALNGHARANDFLASLQQPNADFREAGFYNALEFPVFRKYPLLAMIREFLELNGALVARMSGSGSAVFAIAEHESAARALQEKATSTFTTSWTALSPL